MLRIYKTLIKGLNWSQRNGKISHAPGSEELMSLKWAYYTKQSTNSMQSLSNNPCHFSQNWNKPSKILYGMIKDTELPNQYWANKHRVGGITLPDFRQHYKATAIKTVWYWYNNWHTDQWNRRENPERNPDAYGQLIFDKRGKNIMWEKVSSASGAGNTGQLHVPLMKLEHTIRTCTKINSKWIKTWMEDKMPLKHLESNIGKTLSELNHTSIFSCQSPKAIEMKRKLIQWYWIKLKGFCTAKETIKKNLKKTTEG